MTRIKKEEFRLPSRVNDTTPVSTYGLGEVFVPKQAQTNDVVRNDREGQNRGIKIALWVLGAVIVGAGLAHISS